MIIVKSPLRISLGGGGTDLPNYFQKYGGFVIGIAINRYITIVINQNLKNRFELKYSEYEISKKISGIKHKIIKECLKLFSVKQGLEISSFSDVPHGTGLGSSGAFTVCLLKALHEFFNKKISNRDLVYLAFKIERTILKRPVGYQDQIASCYGGITKQVYDRKGFNVKKIKPTNKIINEINKNFLLIYTGVQRNSAEILNTQENKSKNEDTKIIQNLDEIKKIGKQVYKMINENNFKNYGSFLNKHWEAKKKLNYKINNRNSKKIIKICKKNKVEGLRVVGAGAGGYILAYSKNIEKLKKELTLKNIIFIKFKLDTIGTDVIYNNNLIK